MTKHTYDVSRSILPGDEAIHHQRRAPGTHHPAQALRVRPVRSREAEPICGVPADAGHLRRHVRHCGQGDVRAVRGVGALGREGRTWCTCLEDAPLVSGCAPSMMPL